MNAYLLTLGSLILVGGSLGDIYGERRIFSIGVAGFGVASLLCAIAPTIETLVAARALQGVASALLTPGVARRDRDDLRRRARARRGDRHLDGLGRDRDRARPARRRLDRRRRLVALDLRGQRAVRPRHAGADPASAVAAGEGGGPARAAWTSSARVLCALGLAGPVFALTEQPHARLERSGRDRRARRRRAAARAVRPLRVAGEPPDAAAPACSGAGTSPSRTPRRCSSTRASPRSSSSSSSSCSRSPAGRRSRAGSPAVPVTRDHVLPLAALRRARRPARPAALHGRRPAGRRGRSRCSLVRIGRRTSTT